MWFCTLFNNPPTVAPSLILLESTGLYFPTSSGDAKFPHDLGIFFSASSASIDDTTQCIDVKGDDVFAYEGELDKNDDNCIGTLLGTLPEAKVKPDEFISGKRVTCVTLETPR